MIQTIQTITNWLLTTVTMLTAMGVFMHDGRLDRVILTGGDAPLDAAHIARSGHTHADINTSADLLGNSFGYQSPAVPPKNRSDRKHRLDLPDTLRHAFDDMYLPIVS